MSKQHRERLRLALRFRILERCRFRCSYCGTPASETPLVVDHIVPLAQGGADDATNMTASCRPCNGGKGDRLLEIVAS